jgi:hypothetical protein
MISPMTKPKPMLAIVAASALVALMPATAAFAQTAKNGDSGWFDPDAPAPADSKAAPAPAQPAAAQPAPAEQATPAEPAPQGGYADTDPSALTDFRPALDPYGHWVQDPAYGVVWVPHQTAVGADFAPYVTSGHWALTADNDWIWVSDYPFGWVVFHYGRWVWIPGTGWAWIPGRQYANAWVVWRVPSDSYAYVGWAPAPPAWVWVDGVAVTLWFTPGAAYVFCPSPYVFSYHMHTYIVHDHHHVYYIARHTHRYAAPRGTLRRGPALSQARVPATAVPTQRTAADPRAVAASSRQTSSRALTGVRPATQPLRRPSSTASLTARQLSPTSRSRLQTTRSLGTTQAPSAQPGAEPRPLVLPRNMSRSVRAPSATSSAPSAAAPRVVEPPAPRPAAPAAPREVAPAPRTVPAPAERTAPASAPREGSSAGRSTRAPRSFSPSFAPAPTMRSPSASPSFRSAPSFRAAPPAMRSAPSLSSPRGGAGGGRSHRR